MSGSGRGLRRREWLRIAGTVGATSLAGCTDGLPSLGGGSGGGDGWTQFRGDARNTGAAPASAGPADAPGPAWELAVTDLLDAEQPTVAGRAVSSPVVVDGTLVVNAAVGYLDGDQVSRFRYVLGLDSESGDVVWDHERSVAHTAAATDPVVVDGSVVALALDPEAGETLLSVYDPASGERRDEATFDGFLRTMTVGSDVVYARRDTAVLALDPSDWSVAWSTDTGYRGRVFDHPAVADGRVIVSEGAEFAALDAETGDEQWRTTHEIPGDLVYGGGATPFADPVVVDGTAYAAGSLRTVYSRGEAGLVAFDPESGDEAWRFTPDVDEPEGDSAVGVSGVHGYPLVVDGSLYVTGFRGVFDAGGDAEMASRETLLFELDPDSGEPQDEHAIDGLAVAPVAAGSTLYLPGVEGVASVSADGSVDGVTDGSPRLARSPAVADGRVFVATRTGLVAIGESS